MNEATKDDIRAVHNRIDSLVSNQVDKEMFNKLVIKVDSLVEGQTQLLVSLTQIQTIQEMTPEIELPERPCPEHAELKKNFEKHIDSHKENLRFWQKPFIAMLFDLFKMSIIFAAGWLFSKLKI
jgi:hypothetical protein